MNNYIIGNIYDNILPQNELRFFNDYQFANNQLSLIKDRAINRIKLNRYIHWEEVIRHENMIQLKKIIQRFNPEDIPWSTFLFMMGYYLKINFLDFIIKHLAIDNEYKRHTKNLSPGLNFSWLNKHIIKGMRVGGHDNLVSIYQMKMFIKYPFCN